MKYICQVCGYVYDEDKEKVKFVDLPSDWKCPLCGANKSDFKAEEVKTEIIKKESIKTSEVKLTVGEMSALCSNLARGCEKQYKNEEAELFKKLAAYFDSISPKEENAKVINLANSLKDDIEYYPFLRNVADANKDRGTARVCVWGEKVTRMLSSLVQRYLKEKEKMLEGTDIWVCSICGFIYIGDKAPELCPVCKVPSWKFEKIEGRK